MVFKNAFLKGQTTAPVGDDIKQSRCVFLLFLNAVGGPLFC